MSLFAVVAFRRWKSTTHDPTHPKRFKEAEARAARTLEDEAVRRAHEGLRKPVLYKGEPVFVLGQMLYETEYSDRLLILLLKANNAEKFKDRQDLTHKFSGRISDMTPEQLREMEAELLQLHPQLALEGKTVVDGTAGGGSAAIDPGEWELRFFRCRQNKFWLF